MTTHTILTKQIPVAAGRLTNFMGETRNVTYLECECYFAKGTGIGGSKNNGYYISVNPILVENIGGVEFEKYALFSGERVLAVACARKSKANEAKAIAFFNEHIEGMIYNMYPDFDGNGMKVA